MLPSGLGKTECQKSNLQKEKKNNRQKRKSNFWWWYVFTGYLFLKQKQQRGMLRSAEERACLGKKKLHMMAPGPYSYISSCCEPVAILGSIVLEMALEGRNTQVCFKWGHQCISARLYYRTLNAVGTQPQKSVCKLLQMPYRPDPSQKYELSENLFNKTFL